MRLTPSFSHRTSLHNRNARQLRTLCLARHENGTRAPAMSVALEAKAVNTPTKRRLILMRHADSEDNSQYRDHDRPISQQGKLEAADFARRLQETGWLPDLIIASNAKRTRQTLDEMADAVAKFADVDSHFLGSLYTVAALDGQTRSHLQECIVELADDLKTFCIMCIGHNKGWEEAASSFCGTSVRLKTATAAVLESSGETWAELLTDSSKWALVQVVSPH